MFGVKDSLIKDFDQRPAGTPTPDGRDLAGQDWAHARFNIILVPRRDLKDNSTIYGRPLRRVFCHMRRYRRSIPAKWV